MSEARAGRGAQGRVGTVINGKWQVDARIGTGGMATVYSATHRNGHRAAIKMLHLPLSRDPATRARFLREGYVANAVGHPGVVGVIDDGITEDGAVFLVLELLEGETIDDRRVRLGGMLPLDEVLEVAEQALDALAVAHEKGIIHRDVKPENVFLTNEGTVKLLDFGLARMKDAQAEATKTGVTIGTPEFMPPEQAMGRRDAVDARADIWALGATLFTLLTGRYVHEDAKSLQEQLIASATQRSRPIREIMPQLPHAIASVIDRALELEIEDRWKTAREMQNALRSACGKRTDRGDSDRSAKAVARDVPPVSLDHPQSSDKTVQLDRSVMPRPDARHSSPRAVRTATGPPPPPPFRSQILTPSDGMTLRASPRDLEALEREAITLSRHSAPPNTPVSPRGFPVDPVGATVRAFSKAELTALQQGQSPGPVTPHGPQPGVQSTMAIPQQPQYAQPHSYIPPPPHALAHERRPTGPHAMRPQQPSSTRVIVLVALVFAVLCMLMAVILLTRGGSPIVR